MIQIDLFPCVVDFSVGTGVPYDHRSVANTERASRQITRVAFFPYGACTTPPILTLPVCQSDLVLIRSKRFYEYRTNNLVQLHAFSTEEVQT